MDDFRVYTCTSKTKPTITINDVAVPEGDRGLTDAVFTISLSHAYALPVSVRVRVREGTADEGNDYVADSDRHRDHDSTFDDGSGKDAHGRDHDDDDFETVTIKPLTLSAQFIVKVRGDKRREANETFFVRLHDAHNGVIGSVSGTGTILNDDAPTSHTTSSGSGSEK
jgi:hypothetical protein